MPKDVSSRNITSHEFVKIRAIRAKNFFASLRLCVKFSAWRGLAKITAVTTARRLTSAPSCATSKPPRNGTAGLSRHLVNKGEFNLLALHRPSSPATRHPSRIYLSTGIHGDEPAGPLAALRLLQENQWPENAELWFCPCLNPMGFVLNRRENADGKDLNRDYRHLETTEVRAHIAWLERQPQFDLCLCLHEDWESHGFYVYELNPDENRPRWPKP